MSTDPAESPDRDHHAQHRAPGRPRTEEPDTDPGGRHAQDGPAPEPEAAPDRDVDADDHVAEPETAPEGVVAEGLGMHTAQGWVYRRVDLVADPGQVVEVRGPGGTGRSMLLLTLAGRAKATEGTLRVFGHPLPHGSHAVRQTAAVARIGAAIAPEEQQTVHQAFVERARWDRVHPPGSDGFGYRLDEVRELTGLEADDHDRIEALPRVQQTLLAVALGLLSRPGLLVLDDLDLGLPVADQQRVWAALHAAAVTDHTIAIASTAGGPPPRDGRLIVELHPSHVEES